MYFTRWAAKISPRITKRDQHETHHGDDRGKDAPTFIFALFRDIFGEYGDERDAERATGDQVIQEIGQGKGGVVSAGGSVRADLMRDGPVAKKSQNAAEQHAGHHDTRRGGNAAVQMLGRHERNGRWFDARGLVGLRAMFPTRGGRPGAGGNDSTAVYPTAKSGAARRLYSRFASCSASADSSVGSAIPSRGGVPSGAARRYWIGQLTRKPSS